MKIDDEQFPLEVGMVFKCTSEKINHGLFVDQTCSIIKVGYPTPQIGVLCGNDFDRIHRLFVVEHLKDVVDRDASKFLYKNDTMPLVFARKLAKDGSYDPNEELVCFYVCADASYNISPMALNIIKIMRKVVSFIDQPDVAVVFDESSNESVSTD